MDPQKPFRDYTAEEVLALATQCEWPSDPYFDTKFGKHRKDWEDSIRRWLTRDEYEELYRRVLMSTRSTIYYYRNKSGRPRFGIMMDIKMPKMRLKNAGIIIDPENFQIRGVWRIKHDKRYFEEHKPIWRRVR